MLTDPVYLLPIFAIAICIIVPIGDTGARYTKSAGYRAYKIRLHKKKIALRLVFVTVTILSTMLALIGPERSISKISQALIVMAVAISLLYFIYLSYQLIRRVLRRNGFSDAELNVHEEGTVAVSPYNQKSALRNTQYNSPKISLPTEYAGKSIINTLPAIDLSLRSNGTSNPETPQPVNQLGYVPAGEMTKGQLERSSDVPARDNDNQAIESIQSEMELPLKRVAELVDFHQLDGLPLPKAINGCKQLHVRSKNDSAEVGHMSINGQPIADRALIPGDASAIDEIKLRAVNKKLEKLVIAQQAAYEAVRRAHNHSRKRADEALKFMDIARRAQVIAEKALRREQQERRRVELMNEELQRQLSREMSVVERTNTIDSQLTSAVLE